MIYGGRGMICINIVSIRRLRVTKTVASQAKRFPVSGKYSQFKLLPKFLAVTIYMSLSLCLYRNKTKQTNKTTYFYLSLVSIL